MKVKTKKRPFKTLGTFKVSGFKWGEVGNSSIIDPTSIKNLIDNNDKFKHNLKNRKLVGSITHGPRLEYNPLTNAGDILLNQGKEAFVTSELWYDDVGVFGKIEVLDTPEGRRLMGNLDGGVGLQPSIGIRIDPDKTITDNHGVSTVYVIDCYGFDLTLTPAYDTYCVPDDLKMYSKIVNKQKYLLKNSNETNLFFSSSYLNPKTIDEQLNPDIRTKRYVMTPRHYIDERTRKFIEIYPIKIEGLKKYITSTPYDEILRNKKLLVEYIEEPLIKHIESLLLSENLPNVRLSIGIDKFISSTKLIGILQSLILRIKNNENSIEIQNDFNNAIAMIIEDLFKYITSKSDKEVQLLFSKIYKK